MYTFIIQAEKSNEYLLPSHDFSYALIEAIKYNNWFNNEKIYDYILDYELPNLNMYLSENRKLYSKDNYIPIGSVEYVSNYINRFNNKINIKPINIPTELGNDNDNGHNFYLRRNVSFNSFPEHCRTKNIFVKDNSKIKGIAELIPVDKYDEFIKKNKLTEYIVSEEKEINSEWRAFVFNGKLLDVKNYSGEFYCYPDVDMIQWAVSDYKNCPPAYTMDFGVDNNGDTFLIECHNFFSCGLYGFADYKNLPQMFIKSYKWQLMQ